MRAPSAVSDAPALSGPSCHCPDGRGVWADPHGATGRRPQAPGLRRRACLHATRPSSGVAPWDWVQLEAGRLPRGPRCTPAVSIRPARSRPLPFWDTGREDGGSEWLARSSSSSLNALSRYCLTRQSSGQFVIGTGLGSSFEKKTSNLIGKAFLP